MTTQVDVLVSALSDKDLAQAHCAIFQGAPVGDEAARLGVTAETLYAAWNSWTSRQQARYKPQAAAHGRQPGVRRHEQAEIREAFRAAGVDPDRAGRP